MSLLLIFKNHDSNNTGGLVIDQPTDNNISDNHKNNEFEDSSSSVSVDSDTRYFDNEPDTTANEIPKFEDNIQEKNQGILNPPTRPIISDKNNEDEASDSSGELHSDDEDNNQEENQSIPDLPTSPITPDEDTDSEIIKTQKISSDIYEINRIGNWKNYIIGIEPLLGLDSFKNNIDNDNTTLKIFSIDDIEITNENTYIGTGMILRLIIDDIVHDQLRIIVRGDIDGDGIIDIVDYSELISHISGYKTYTKFHLKAMDLNQDSEVTDIDLIIMSQYIGKITININEPNIKIKSLATNIYDIVKNSMLDPNLNNTYIIGMEDKTTIKSFKNSFFNDSEDLKIFSIDGIEITDENYYIGTGMIIRLIIDDIVYDRLRIVIRGDINGDGFVNMTDYSNLISYINGQKSFTNFYLKALDINQDNRISFTDIYIVQQYMNRVLDNLNDPNIIIKKVVSHNYNVINGKKPDLNLNNTYIIGMEDKTTINDFKNDFANYADLKIFSIDDIEITNENTYIGTGMILKLIIDDIVYSEYRLIVRGDIDGNGIVNTVDIGIIQNHILGIEEKEGYLLKAMDVNDDSNINVGDTAEINLYILGSINSLNKLEED